jgi:DNA-binding response OmpR family regulator
LNASGHAVEDARGRRDALELLRMFRYDLIILDWIMPGVSGTDVCRQLRAAGDRTPILMLTARYTAEDRASGLDAGADDYLTKPFDNKILRARVSALLARATA